MILVHLLWFADPNLTREAPDELDLVAHSKICSLDTLYCFPRSVASSCSSQDYLPSTLLVSKAIPDSYSVLRPLTNWVFCFPFCQKELSIDI